MISKPQMKNAPPPSPQPRSIKSPEQAPTSSIKSSVVTGFGHGIGMSIASTMVRSIFPINNEHVPKVIDKCRDLECEFDKCFKDKDSENCYDIVRKYKQCLIKNNCSW
jgi:hypothetical protein